MNQTITLGEFIMLTLCFVLIYVYVKTLFEKQ